MLELDPPPIRSYLYAPGSNRHVMAKALGAGADAVILDLEDSVPPGEKRAARDQVAAVVAEAGSLRIGPRELHVRVNHGPDGPDLDDVAAVTVRGLAGIRLPKIGSADEVRAVAAALDALEAEAGMRAGTVRLYLSIETAAAALASQELAAAPRVARLVFGATDFLADIASPGTTEGPATALARGMLVLASRAAGIGAPVDCVHTVLDDEEGLRRAAIAAREMGFYGKSVIHPRQIHVVDEVFRPSDAELAEARRILAHAEAHGEGATALDGRLIDAAVVARAARVVGLSGTGLI
ncbi:MAG TPA: CoA ester lyase [Solirubrobacteraceae bacterium]|nr:CoA ester lyase [Solirubrobacteraceae bacterium]